MLTATRQGADPTRIAAYVVSGAGFLGAGVILRDDLSVRGINSAATIWCSSAVGVLAGAGYITQAIIGTLLVVAAHLVLRPVGRRIDRLPADGGSGQPPQPRTRRELGQPDRRGRPGYGARGRAIGIGGQVT